MRGGEQGPAACREISKRQAAGRPVLIVVRIAGVEPARQRQGILSPRCLPFHHIRKYRHIIAEEPLKSKRMGTLCRGKEKEGKEGKSE